MDSIETGQVFEYKIIKGDGQSDVHYSFIADDDSPCFYINTRRHLYSNM